MTRVILVYNWLHRFCRFFLYSGTTFAFFQADGKQPDSSDVFAKILMGSTKLSAHFFKILFPIPSMPQDLLWSRDFNIFSIFSFFIVIEFSSVLGIFSLMSSSSKSADARDVCDTKNSFNKVALASSSVYVIPFMISVGIF